MFANYLQILRLPGAFKFSVAGLIYRYPMAVLGISLVLMIPLYYGNYTIAGLASAVMTISFSLTAPFIARLVDRRGQLKVMGPALVLASSGLLLVILAIVNQVNPLWLYLACAISGAFSGSAGSLVRARWSHLVRLPSQLRTAFALEAAWDELAYTTGPPLATFLVISVHPTAGLTLALVMSVVGGIWFLSQRGTEPPPQDRSRTPHQGSVLRNPAMILLVVTYIVTGVIFGVCDVATVAFCDDLGQKWAAGVALGVFAAGSMISAILYGARNWRTPLWKLFGIGMTMLSVGVSLFALATNVPALALIMFLTGFSIAPTMTNVNALVERVVPDGRLTEGLAWMTTAMTIGVAGGSAIGGRIVDVATPHTAFLLIIGLAWATFLVVLGGLPLLRRAEAATRPEIGD